MTYRIDPMLDHLIDEVLDSGDPRLAESAFGDDPDQRYARLPMLPRRALAHRLCGIRARRDPLSHHTWWVGRVGGPGGRSDTQAGHGRHSAVSAWVTTCTQ